MHCYSFFFAGIMIFFGGLAGRFAVVSNQKINAQIHFGMIAFGGGILLVAVALVFAAGGILLSGLFRTSRR